MRRRAGDWDVEQVPAVEGADVRLLEAVATPEETDVEEVGGSDAGPAAAGR